MMRSLTLPPAEGGLTRAGTNGVIAANDRPVWLLPDIVIRVKRFDKRMGSPGAPGVR